MARLNRRKFLRAASGLFVPAALLRSDESEAEAQVVSPGPIMRTMSSAVNMNTGLVAYWKLDEVSNGSVSVTRVDSGGNGQDLSDPTKCIDATGKISRCIIFEISGGVRYLEHADSTFLSTGDINFFFGGWFMLTTQPNNMGLLAKWGAAGNREYLFYYDQTANRFKFAVSNDGTAATIVTASTLGAISTLTWYYMIFGHDADNNQLFISGNGGAYDTAAHTTGVFDGTYSFTLGKNPSASSPTDQPLDGRIDELGMWKRTPPTAAEVSYLYNSGTGKTCCPFA